MAIIKCPECGKEVSEKAEICIHCGYPLKESQKEILYDVVFEGINDNKSISNNRAKVVGQIRQLKSIGLTEAKDFIDNPPGVIISGTSLSNANWVKNALSQFGCSINIKVSSELEKSMQDSKISNYTSNGGGSLLCPHCGSNQITTGQRGYSLFSGFFGSNKTVNRCAVCGWSWEPRG